MRLKQDGNETVEEASYGYFVEEMRIPHRFWNQSIKTAENFIKETDRCESPASTA